MTRFTGTVCLLLLGGLLIARATAQDKPAQSRDQSVSAKPPSAADQIRMMKPGKEHEELARLVGTWDVEVRMGSGKQGGVSNGSGTSRMKVGGRFLEIEYQARSDKSELEGIFSIGFDHRHQKYVLVAMDSFGTYFVTSQGTRDEKTGKIRMAGTDDNPTMKAMGYTKEFLHVLDQKSDDEFDIEVWFVDTRTPARKEIKAMEFRFRRRK